MADRIIPTFLAVLFAILLPGCPPLRAPPTSPFGGETFAVGQRYYLKNDYASAAARFDEYLAFRLSPSEEAAGRYWLGRSLLMLGRAADAVEEFGKALECPPTGDIAGLVQLGRADALRALSRANEAEQDYRSIINRNAASDPVDVAMIRLAQLLTERGRQVEARKVMQDYASRFPDSPIPGDRQPTQPSGRFSVQAGAYSEKNNAAILASVLRGKGFDARLDEIAGRWCVRVGRFATRAEAQAEARRLREAGHDAFTVE